MNSKNVTVKLWSLGVVLILFSCAGYLWNTNDDKIWFYLMCSIGFIGSLCLVIKMLKLRNHAIFKKSVLLDLMFTGIPLPMALLVKHLLKMNNIESNVTLILVYGILATSILLVENKLIRNFLQENKQA